MTHLIDLARALPAAVLPLPEPFGTAMPCAMTEAETARFETALRGATSFLEFGVGGSTVLAAELVPGDLVAVDNNAGWLVKVGGRIGDTAGRDRMRLHWADIGPTGGWGRPRGITHRELWPRYHRDIWDRVDASAFDLFLVDGRFRVACFLQIVARCRPDAVILVHDYVSRREYHQIAQFGREIWRVDDLAAFAPKPGDAATLAGTLERHAHISD